MKQGYTAPPKAAHIKPAQTKLRILTQDECAALLAALDPTGCKSDLAAQRQANWDFTVWLMDTGARYSEIGKLRWNQVDLANRSVTVHRLKNGRDTVLPMTQRMVEIVERRAKTKSDEWLFPERAGAGGRHIMRIPANVTGQSG